MKKGDKKYSPYHVKNISVIILYMSITVLLFSSDGLLKWAESFEYGSTRNFWITMMTPFDAFSDNFNLTAPKEKLNKGFRSAAGLLKEVYNFAAADSAAIPDSTAEMKEKPQTPLEKFRKNIERLRVSKSNKNPLRVLLVGDSMMGSGLGGEIKKSLVDDSLFQAVRFSELSSGLNRIDVFDWYKKSEVLLRGNQYDILIAVFGTNDAQPIEDDGRSYYFSNPNWDSVYTKRVAKYLKLIHDKVDIVYWLGLPLMRDDGFTGRLNKINGINKSQIEKYPNIVYFPLAELTDDSDGNYTSFGMLNGKNVRIRMGDGIHFTENGGKIVAHHLKQRIIYDIFEGLRPEFLQVTSSQTE